MLVLTDANAYFGTVVETARLLSFSKQIPDLIVVGIGYSNPGQAFRAINGPRTYDLTPSADPATVKSLNTDSAKLGFPDATGSGGAPEFLSWIRSELLPVIVKKYHASSEDRAYLGHSFGGLFGV